MDQMRTASQIFEDADPFGVTEEQDGEHHSMGSGGSRRTDRSEKSALEHKPQVSKKPMPIPAEKTVLRDQMFVFLEESRMEEQLLVL